MDFKQRAKCIKTNIRIRTDERLFALALMGFEDDRAATFEQVGKMLHWHFLVRGDLWRRTQTCSHAAKDTKRVLINQSTGTPPTGATSRCTV